MPTDLPPDYKPAPPPDKAPPGDRGEDVKGPPSPTPTGHPPGDEADVGDPRGWEPKVPAEGDLPVFPDPTKKPAF